MVSNPILVKHNYLYYIAFILLAILVQVFVMNNEYGFSLLHSFSDALVHWLLLSVICFGLLNVFSFVNPPRYQLVIVLLLPLVISYMAVHFTSFILAYSFSESDLVIWLEQTKIYRATVSYLLLASTLGFAFLWYRVSEEKALEKRQQETDAIAREAELFKLRQQIQPHFLFNALNSINSLVGSRPKDARRMVQKLSDFLRATLKKEEGDLLPFSDEITQLNLYLDLEQMRFGHRLHIERYISGNALNCNIPPLLLQPLVENAIKYGLYGTTEDLVIQFKAEKRSNLLIVEFINPFDSETEQSGGTGFGLNSVERRLYLLYGRKDLLEVTAEKKLFTARLKIPQADV
jgi:two-component system LytT family sensor kinase